MESHISLTPVQGSEVLTIRSSFFPGSAFTHTLPEAIGSTSSPVWGAASATAINPAWEKTDEGGWEYQWRRDGLLGFSVRTIAEGNEVTIRMRLQNLSGQAWPESFSFNCLGPRGALEFGDFDGKRTFLLFEKEWVPVTKIQRIHGPRPTIQLWYLRGKVRKLGFVEAFEATPPVYPEGVLAVRSYDGKHVIAVSASSPLFLFANLEFSCIHCCPTFGPLQPDQEGAANGKFFICPNTTLDQLRRRLETFWD